MSVTSQYLHKYLRIPKLIFPEIIWHDKFLTFTNLATTGLVGKEK